MTQRKIPIEEAKLTFAIQPLRFHRTAGIPVGKILSPRPLKYTLLLFFLVLMTGCGGIPYREELRHDKLVLRVAVIQEVTSALILYDTYGPPHQDFNQQVWVYKYRTTDMEVDPMYLRATFQEIGGMAFAQVDFTTFAGLKALGSSAPYDLVLTIKLIEGGISREPKRDLKRPIGDQRVFWQSVTSHVEIRMQVEARESVLESEGLLFSHKENLTHTHPNPPDKLSTSLLLKEAIKRTVAGLIVTMRKDPKFGKFVVKARLREQRSYNNFRAVRLQTAFLWSLR